MHAYVDNVIVPYVESQRDKLPLSRSEQKALCVFDVFAAHRGQELLDKLNKNNIGYLFVPASCTDYCQPPDLPVVCRGQHTPRLLPGRVANGNEIFAQIFNFAHKRVARIAPN